MNKFFSTLAILYCGILSSHAQFQDNPRLGDLTKNDRVLTAVHPYMHNGYPVFEITVPAGYTEIQVRASLTNFEPGFLLKKDGIYIYNFIPTGEFINGKKKYKALGTFTNNSTVEPVSELVATWSGTQWVIMTGALTPNLVSSDDVEYPWLCTTFTGGDAESTYSVQIEYFVYRTCTTGAAADPEWGLGSGDPDPWVYIANQSATPGDNTEFKRQKWDPATSLTSQLQPPSGDPVPPGVPTPGYKVIFQPGRGNLGAAEWLQANKDKLVWIYQVEDVAGKPKHPNGSDVWNSMVPTEWRVNRIQLFTFDTP